jgi:hypothetical protein
MYPRENTPRYARNRLGRLQHHALGVVLLLVALLCVIVFFSSLTSKSLLILSIVASLGAEASLGTGIWLLVKR